MLNISNRQIYTYLLKHSLTKCTEFILVVRSELELNSNGTRVLDTLKPYLKEEIKAYEWPGTEMVKEGKPATIYHYYLNEETMNILLESANNLYSWVQPDLPEDLCFINQDGTPWLCSVGHEKMSWFEDEANEDLDFIQSINNLAK